MPGIVIANAIATATAEMTNTQRTPTTSARSAPIAAPLEIAATAIIRPEMPTRACSRSGTPRWRSPMIVDSNE